MHILTVPGAVQRQILSLSCSAVNSPRHTLRSMTLHSHDTHAHTMSY